MYTGRGKKEWQAALSCRNLVTCPSALLCTPFLSRISTRRFKEFAPSEPKQVSLLLTQPFPLNSNIRVSLSFCFVFWGLLQAALAQDWQQSKQQLRTLTASHRSWCSPYNLRLLQSTTTRSPSSLPLQPQGTLRQPFIPIAVCCPKLLFQRVRREGRKHPSLPFPSPSLPAPGHSCSRQLKRLVLLGRWGTSTSVLPTTTKNSNEQLLVPWMSQSSH